GAGRTSEDRQQRAEAISAERGLAIVPPFDHADIIAGQATVGLEIEQQLPDVRTVVVPVGGGGLIAGVVTGLAAAGSEARVWGVEPAGAPKLTRSPGAVRPVPPTVLVVSGGNIDPALLEDCRRLSPEAAAKILVADDDQSLVRTLTWILKENGYDVVVAPGGEGLIGMLEEERPNLLLLDIMMPKVDGLQLLAKMKADDRFRDVPVLMISSMPPEEATVKSLGLGAADFISKPFRVRELRARV